MTTSQSSPVLKDVVAYVDVWSSEKTANYSKPFVQQLQEMGAQVSKAFNKQVTHVIFNNGHLATWRKAKKSNVRLVSVLWVGRCYDDGVRVDEDLYPAINDESNPVLKNKKHRCMQPKDSPERTPENDRRMRKKLDKMMKDLVPKQPLVADVSSIIIDEESGIVYSPALKRSDYMAQRLKDMKEKRENLSLTESQMVESCSPTRLNPSLGSTPTVVRLMFNQSEEDSSVSVAEPGCSPDKEGVVRPQGKAQVEATDHGHLEKHHGNGFEKPWMSPCREVPGPLKFPDFDDKEKNSKPKPRRTSVRRKLAEKCTSVGSLENPHQDKIRKSENAKNCTKEKRKSQIKSSSPSSKMSEKGKLQANKTLTETMTHACPDVKLSSCLLSPGISHNAAVRLSNDTGTPRQRLEQKISKRARQSFSALVRAFTVSDEYDCVAPASTEGDDDVFEDYFSPANYHNRSKNNLVSKLSVESDICIPFELEPVPKKRAERRSEGGGSERSSKRRKMEGRHHQQLDSNPQPQHNVKESVPALDSPSASLTLVNKRRRQSTLPFTSTIATTSNALKHGPASEQSVLTEDKPVKKQEKKSEVSVDSNAVESRGNECTVAAGLIATNSEGDVTHNKQMSLSLHKMDICTKTARTLVMTSMPTEKQHTVGQVVKALGGFLIVDQVCESTTHVVCGGHRRTLNILLGIARGCWILSYEWILWCLEQRQWIPEEPYELSDQFPAAQICRLQRHLSAGEHQQDLFQGQPAMFVSPQSQPPMQSLMELIELCGGKVCKTVRQAGICIGKYSGRRPEGSRILSEQWVLDCITHLNLLPYDNYDLK